MSYVSFVVAVGGHPISHVFSFIWLFLHLGSLPVNNVPGYELSFSRLWKQDKGLELEEVKEESFDERWV